MDAFNHTQLTMAALPQYDTAPVSDEVGVEIKSPTFVGTALSLLCFPLTAMCSWYVRR